MKTETKQDGPRQILTEGNGEPTRDEIAHAAYYLWEHQGRPQNQDVQIWLQAETQLLQSQASRGVQK